MADNEIKNLFEKRDRAVSKNNKLLFLSTQIDEIQGSYSDGYLASDKLKTTILYVTPEKKEVLSKVAFVKEEYYKNGKKSHSGYLIYYLVNTTQSWKIYKIVY